jgi:hypothetical protein
MASFKIKQAKAKNEPNEPFIELMQEMIYKKEISKEDANFLTSEFFRRRKR